MCDAIHLNVDSIHEATIATFDANIIRFDPIMCQNLCIINGLMAAPSATVDNNRIFSCSENCKVERECLSFRGVSSVLVCNDHHCFVRTMSRIRVEDSRSELFLRKLKIEICVC